MADDLISRQALLAAFRTYMVEHFDKDKCADAGNCKVCEKRCLWHEVVASVPAVDAVEVVRCKDCKHGELNCNLKEKEYVVCELDEHHVWRPNGFCSYGERREENAE